MLYEVITLLRHLKLVSVLPNLKWDINCHDNQQRTTNQKNKIEQNLKCMKNILRKNIRITSYNVCYTKLLR